MPKRRRSRLSQRGWDLVIEGTVIVTSTIIASLILAFLLGRLG
jgi:hypothetical protein